MRQRIIPGVVQENNALTLNEKQSAEDALQAMRARNIGAVCVCDDDGHLVGIITERDVMAHIMDSHLLDSGPHAQSTALREIMARNPEILHADDDALDVMELMVERKVRHLPVVSPENRVIAMVSMHDLLCAAVKILTGEVKHARNIAFAPEDE